ncbi:hypothetical protein I6N95_17390 [Vagococcus sp. BWB3-3]|uniref:Uncharacterized protein n=1 Tax=Vagococcus allomyrinae TaxID=2794353 RepID=A0A940SVZ2_9ENTE|nr:hypothetical protein [Vagococcus allomyrinae]MBP1042795.1 hypothetical protein [Vagococcus allomyrinae]
MNINLLPDKFIKNRAMEVILFITAIAFAAIIFLLISLFLINQLRVASYTSEVNNKKMEKITVEKQVTELEQSQLVELQGFVTLLKEGQPLMMPILKAFSQTASKANLVLMSYEVALVEGDEQGEGNLGEDGSELLPVIMIRARGDFYKAGPAFMEAIERLEWVYDCKPISVSKEADYAESDYVVRLKKADIPMVSRLEAKAND